MAIANPSQCYHCGPDGVRISAIPAASICSCQASVVQTPGLQAGCLPGILFACTFWRQCLSMKPRLTLNLQSSYLNLLKARAVGVAHRTWKNSSGDLGCILSPNTFRLFYTSTVSVVFTCLCCPQLGLFGSFFSASPTTAIAVAVAAKVEAVPTSPAAPSSLLHVTS